ncbi:6755_t:CDS:10, partial [Racocetra fulgida]
QIKIPSISISALSKYHQFVCDKLLRNILDEDNERRQSVNTGERKVHKLKIDNSTLRDAVKSRGGDFETKVVEDLEKRLRVIDCTLDDPSKALVTLQNAQVGEVLYQLKFDVPDDLHDHLKIKNVVRLKSFIPDFIEIVEENGKKRLVILDAKSSKGTRASHQLLNPLYPVSSKFQVAAYAYLLKYLTKDMPHISVSKIGGIFLPKNGGVELQTFRTDFLLSKIEKFLITDLVEIATASEVSWHYNSRCKTCEFVDDCRSDAKGSMAMIPYLSTDNANYLKLFVKDTWIKEKKTKKDTAIEDLENIITIDDSELDELIQKLKKITPNDYVANPKLLPLIKDDKDRQIDIEDLADDFSKLKVNIEDLADCIDKLSIDDEKVTVNDSTVNRRIKQIIKYNKDRKKSPYIDAFETEKAQFIGTPTASFPQKTDHNLVITMSIDPFVLLPFSWAICLYTSDGKVIKKFQYAESISKYKDDENQSVFISLMDKFVTRLTKTFEFLSQKKSRACIFVYSEQEKAMIQESLLKIIRLDGISEAIQHTTTRCLFNLFEDCSLLMAVGSDSDNSSEIPGEWREFPRLVILEQSLSENIAICVPGFYRFMDIWEQMVKPTLEDKQELLTALESEISKIDLEDIYAAWISENVNEDEISKSHLLRAEFVNAVIQAFYALVYKSTGDIASKLLFSPPTFVFSEIRSFFHNYLGKLHFFKQFEAAITYSRTKAVRLKDFAQNETKSGLRVKFDKFMKKENGAGYTARFIVLNCDNEFHVLEPSAIKEFILVDDTPEGILEAIRFSDMRYKDKLFGDPNAWGSSQSEEHTYPKELEETALGLRDSFSMSPSQKEIAATILKKRLQIVWGPPSTENQNFMIGVTAFTRSAIDNLLDRIANVQKEGNKTGDFTIVRTVKEFKNPIDGVNDCKAETLPKKISGGKLGIPGKPIVVGGTVWDWYKIRKEWKGGQWAECLNPTSGKLIVAGDHMNTYPIYGDNHPLIFGSIQQCLMRKEDGSIFNNGDYSFLKKGQKHDFGPCTLQLKDNWRMSGELNNFFQKIYGGDYISKQPSLKLNFEDDKLQHIDNPEIRRILSPETAIALVKLSLKNNDKDNSQSTMSGLLSERVLHAEADVVAQIVKAYFDSLSKTNPQSRKPSLFIVTPHHRQRQTVQSRLVEYTSNPGYNLKINTVEKMQGQEADLVITCFTFLDQNEIVRESDFLFDRNRWNVAIRKNRSKRRLGIIEWKIDGNPAENKID